MTTPSVPPPAATKPNTPIAFARSAGSVKSIIINESETADTTAPPSPWTARAPTSIPCEPASPHASEASRERYVETVDAGRAALGARAPEIVYASTWHLHPRFIEAVAGLIAPVQAKAA